MSDTSLTPLESHKISVLRRVKQVVFDVSPDLLLAFEGLGLIEDLECEAEAATLIEPIIQRNPYSSVVGGVEVPVIAQMPMSEFTGEVKEDTQLTMDVEVEEIEAPRQLPIDVDETEPPRVDEDEKARYTCLSCGQPVCRIDEKVCQSCKRAVVEKSIPIPKPSGLQGKSIDELIDGQPCLNACYDPAKLVQLALTVVDDPLSLTGSFTQKLLGIEKVAGTSQPMIWARYHGENLSNLRPFERKDYLQALLVRRQVHNRERGAAA